MSRSDALVLFGATGDLARKKLFSSLYRLAARGRLDLPVIGVALSGWDNEHFRAHVREAITATVADADADVVERLCERLSLIGGDYADRATFAQLRLELERRDAHAPTFYLAIPPSFFPTVAEGLAGEGRLPLRQLLPRADLEPQLRRQRSGHHVRVVRRGGSRQLL